MSYDIFFAQNTFDAGVKIWVFVVLFCFTFFTATIPARQQNFRKGAFQL